MGGLAASIGLSTLEGSGGSGRYFVLLDPGNAGGGGFLGLGYNHTPKNSSFSLLVNDLTVLLLKQT